MWSLNLSPGSLRDDLDELDRGIFIADNNNDVDAFFDS
jgi:hypothetical protein